ncbi:MAG: membrane protein insertase YidC [Clostridia bacterium]|nr:membrane protein insertase YidC [Clostridia bacterium]
MGAIFDFLGKIFGYVLWFFFDAVSNYALAIVLFVLLINILMIPIAIKRQRTMALTAKINIKDQELRKKYEKNPKKYNEEKALLYEKEGIDPMAGCFSTMILPLILWSGILGAVVKPLENTLHIDSQKVSQAVQVLSETPEFSELKNNNVKNYEQLHLVRNFNSIKHKLTMFTQEEFDDIEEYSHGFNFFGINLLSRPNNSKFTEFVWIIPVLCLLSSILTIYVTQKSSGTQVQAEGCMKFLPYSTPLIMTYFAYTVPAAVGLYWFLNSIFGAIQSILLNKYYNIYSINAQNEAARLALLENQEALVICTRDLEEEQKEPKEARDEITKRTRE